MQVPHTIVLSSLPTSSISSIVRVVSKLLLSAYYVQGTRSARMSTKWTTFNRIPPLTL